MGDRRQSRQRPAARPRPARRIARRAGSTLRQRQHGEDEEQVLDDDAARGDQRAARLAGDDLARGAAMPGWSPGGCLHANGPGGGGMRGVVAECMSPQSTARAEQGPRGLTTRTARKAIWPARICHSGLIERAEGLGEADA